MRLICAIHDISPSRLAEAAELRRVLDEAVPGPVSLLVIPCAAGVDRWRPGPALRWLRGRIEAGDELVVHGLTHRTGAGRDGAETRGLGRDEIAALVGRSTRELRAIGLVPSGFIAPAYGPAAGIEQAASASGLAWWADRTSLRWCGGAVALPSVGLGASRPSRRAVSPALAAVALALARPIPRLRLDLHTADLHHRRLADAARRLVVRATAQGRVPCLHDDLLSATPRNLAPA